MFYRTPSSVIGTYFIYRVSLMEGPPFVNVLGLSRAPSWHSESSLNLTLLKCHWRHILIKADTLYPLTTAASVYLN